MTRNPKAIIHLDRLCANYELIKKKFSKKNIMCVVKANAYGHGSVKCALALENYGCKSFAVFTIDEGIELRSAGIQSEILVFSRMDIDRLNDAVKNNLILNICDKSDILMIDNYINDGGISPGFHLNIDTGMTRLGVDFNDAHEILKLLKNHSQINCEGIYSHFSTADEGDLSYANDQLDKFNAVLNLADDSDITCFREVYLQSKKLGVGGHMDLLLVDKDNKGYLWDWKTANSFKFKTIFGRKDYGPVSNNYELQVATYGLLIEENKLCDEIVHLGLLYYNKDTSVIKEKLVDLSYMRKAEEYWLNVKNDTNTFLTEPNFGIGKVPVYKWECGKYCSYSHICESPFNKEKESKNVK